jgi:hypothetical protein
MVALKKAISATKSSNIELPQNNNTRLTSGANADRFGLVVAADGGLVQSSLGRRYRFRGAVAALTQFPAGDGVLAPQQDRGHRGLRHVHGRLARRFRNFEGTLDCQREGQVLSQL